MNWLKLSNLSLQAVFFLCGMIFAQMINHWNVAVLLNGIATWLLGMSLLLVITTIRQEEKAKLRALETVRENIHKIEETIDRTGLNTEEFT